MTSRSLATVVAVIVVAITATACQPVHREPALARKVVIIGDSLAWGAGSAPGIKDYLDDYFPNAEVKALGGPATAPVDGFDPATGWSDWALELNHWLSSGFDADVVVIEGCCNRFGDPARWRASIEALIGVARQSDPGGDRRVILTTTPRFVPGTADYYEAYGIGNMIVGTNDIMRTTPGVAVADVDLAWSVDWQPVRDVPGVGVVRGVDGLHFTHAGARDVARIISLS